MKVKLLLGYLMPIWLAVFGITSENVLHITEPVWYAVFAYIAGMVSMFALFAEETFK